MKVLGPRSGMNARTFQCALIALPSVKPQPKPSLKEEIRSDKASLSHCLTCD